MLGNHKSAIRYHPIDGQYRGFSGAWTIVSLLDTQRFDWCVALNCFTVHPHGDNMSDVTRILQSIEQGDPKAADDLLPLVYQELRKLAAQKMAREQPGHTLQAT